MNEVEDTNTSVTWITLKEASRLVGCSVKTIRRRIKAGTWRSMIEYQGQKAIRLVAREDVLQDSSALKKLPYDPVDSNLAVQALQGVHHNLDKMIETNLDNLNRRIGAAVFGSRIYLLLTLVLTAIFIVGALVIFSDSREEKIKRRMMDMKEELSTIIVHGQEISRDANAEATRRSGEAIRLAGDLKKDIQATTLEMEKISSSLNITRRETAGSRKEAKETRTEVAALRLEIAELEKQIRSLHDLLRPADVTVTNDQDTHTPENGDEEDNPPLPDPHPGAVPTTQSHPLPEKKDSDFLGIIYHRVKAALSSHAPE